MSSSESYGNRLTMMFSMTNEQALDRARRWTAASEYDVTSRFPGVYQTGTGAWMIDVEGNRVLDLTSASGVLLLGYRPADIVEAVTRCIRDHGVMFASTLTPQRIELAERLCERYPAGEKAVFCKTGSEATTAMVKLARAYSGRRLILSSGYHGWHQWHDHLDELQFLPDHELVNFGYNMNLMRVLLEEFDDEIAGVIVSPEPAWFGRDTFARFSDMCEEHGVLFMLDEVMTGMRWGRAGLNGTGAVRADLVALSKGIANGHPLSPVLGRREVIDCYDAAGVAGTYTREVPPMAAALAVLDVTEDGGIHRHCEAMGERLQNGLRSLLEREGIAARISGPPLLFDVVLDSDELLADICRHAFEDGAYFDPDGTILINHAFGVEEVDHALTAFQKGIERAVPTYRRRPGAVATGRLDAFARAAFCGYQRDTEDVAKATERILEGIRVWRTERKPG